MATTSIITSKEGIIWRFVNPVSYGQYCTGDYWVQGPVLVSSISPSSTLRSDLTTKNGSMLGSNLATGLQGLDSAVNFQYTYISSLNLGNYISQSSPLALKPGDRLISVSSADTLPAVRWASILTCVSSNVIDVSSFRPGYTDSTVDYINGYELSAYNSKLANFDLTQILTKAEPTYAGLLSSVSSTWFDPFIGFNARFIRPTGAMPYDDSIIAAVISNVALASNYYLTGSNKQELAKYLTQIGIDAYSDLINLNQKWATVGPQGSGKKFCILFAGRMLDNQDYLNVGSDYTVSYGTQNVFPEDTQTFFVSSINGSINYGYGGYSSSDIGLPEWGIEHWNTASLDTSSWVTSAYGSDLRRFFAMKNWVGYLFAAKIMGLQNYWNHDPLFYYFNRYFAKELEIVSQIGTGNIKEALAPSGMEWQYDYVSGMNSYYFPSGSSSRINGVGFHGISTNTSSLLYVESYVSALDYYVLKVLNPLNGSGIFLAGSSTLPNVFNSNSNTSSIIYVTPSYTLAESVSVSATNYMTYGAYIPFDDIYVQMVWRDSDNQNIRSTNAIRIRQNINY